MSFQDWEPVIINKTLKKNITGEPPVNTILPKTKSTANPSVKIGENDEIVSIKTVPKETSNRIIQGRMAKKMTRKMLANGLNLREDVIADIETSKAIYNGNLIARICKFLGC